MEEPLSATGSPTCGRRTRAFGSLACAISALWRPVATTSCSWTATASRVAASSPRSAGRPHLAGSSQGNACIWARRCRERSSITAFRSRAGPQRRSGGAAAKYTVGRPDATRPPPPLAAEPPGLRAPRQRVRLPDGHVQDATSKRSTASTCDMSGGVSRTSISRCGFGGSVSARAGRGLNRRCFISLTRAIFRSNVRPGGFSRRR